MKPRLSSERFALAGYVALATFTGVAAVEWRTEAVLFLLPALILVATFFYRRVVCLAMQFVVAAVSSIAVHVLYRDPINSVVTIICLSLALLMTTEIVYRLRAQKEQIGQALRAGERRFQTLIENSSDGIVLFDATGTILYSSPTITRMLGYGATEVLGTKVLTHVHEEDLPALTDRLQEVLRHPGATVSAHFRRRHKSGAWLWVEATATNLLNEPTVQAVVVNYRDITERRRAEKRIAVLSGLAQKLAAATTPADAAKTILGAAQDLLGWEAAFLHLYLRESDLMIPILTMDLINGQKVEVPRSLIGMKPTGMTRRVLNEGPQLILRESASAAGLELVLIGNKARRSASLMFVPISDGGGAVGILSIQSYTFHSYSREDLQTLQALANHCAGALTRIQEAAERQRIADELRESEARFRTVVENMGEGLLITDLTNVVLYANARMAELCGYAPEEMIGRREYELFVPTAGWEAMRQKNERRAAGISERYEMVLKRKEGTRFWAEINAAPYCSADGEIIGTIGALTDITERKDAEFRTVVFSNLGQKLSAINTPEDAARIIVEMAQELLGWDACALDWYFAEQDRLYPLISIDTIDGRRVDVPSPIADKPPSPMIRRVIQNGAELILRGDTDVRSSELIPFGDTARRSASLMFVPIRHGLRVIGSLTIQSYTPRAYQQKDLNALQALADHCGGALERLRAAEELLNLEAQLRHSQKMEAVGQLSAGVAHDFNNILTIIHGHINLLMAKTELDAEARESMDQVSLASERAANLTSQLLAFSRKRMMQPRQVDLAEIVTNAGRMLHGLLGETIELQFDYSGRLPLIYADIGMLEQVIINLSLNARDAMPHGGKLVIQLAAVEIDSAQVQRNPEARAGPFVRMTVVDTGCGMNADTLNHIFEPFFTTKDVGKGTGLGLASVYGIVKQHHGWIEVESRVGFGTTFWVYFPVRAEAAGPAKPPMSVEKPAGGTETILVVEDETSVRALVKRILSFNGYQVLEAANGREALEIWRDQADRIDLLLTDLVMPGGPSGIELARRLKAERQSLRVIYTSGYSMELGGRDLPLREGVNFLAKPFTSARLSALIRKCLDAPNVTAQ